MEVSARKKIASQLISQIVDFPPLPDVVQEIIETSADPKSSMADLNGLVEGDVALSSAVLKLANSPFFGLSREVASLPHALAVVGMEEIQNLVISNALFQTFKGFVGKQNYLQRLWEHSFNCGLVTKYLGNRCGLSCSECFMAGQLHDLGKVVVIMAFSSQSLTKIYPDGVAAATHPTLEREILGVSHQTLGERLAKNWLFPLRLCEAVGHHHSPEDSGRVQDLSYLVWVADHLLHLLTYTSGSLAAETNRKALFGARSQKLSSELGLGLTTADLDRFLLEIREICDSFK